MLGASRSDLFEAKFSLQWLVWPTSSLADTCRTPPLAREMHPVTAADFIIRKVMFASFVEETCVQITSVGKPSSAFYPQCETTLSDAIVTAGESIAMKVRRRQRLQRIQDDAHKSSGDSCWTWTNLGVIWFARVPAWFGTVQRVK